MLDFILWLLLAGTDNEKEYPLLSYPKHSGLLKLLHISSYFVYNGNKSFLFLFSLHGYNVFSETVTIKINFYTQNLFDTW